MTQAFDWRIRRRVAVVWLGGWAWRHGMTKTAFGGPLIFWLIIGPVEIRIVPEWEVRVRQPQKAGRGWRR